MVFGVIVWVALAALFPTMVVPTIQHAVAPSSVTVTPDGALLVSDDGGNRIWRIRASR